MPNRVFIGAVGVLLIGPGLNAVRTGVVLGRIGSLERASSPLWFRVRVALYWGIGVGALCVAWLRAT